MGGLLHLSWHTSLCFFDSYGGVGRSCPCLSGLRALTSPDQSCPPFLGVLLLPCGVGIFLVGSDEPEPPRGSGEVDLLCRGRTRWTPRGSCEEEPPRGSGEVEALPRGSGHPRLPSHHLASGPILNPAVKASAGVLMTSVTFILNTILLSSAGQAPPPWRRRQWTCSTSPELPPMGG